MSSKDEAQEGSTFVETCIVQCYICFFFAAYAGEEDDSAVHHVFDYQDYLMHRRTRNFA